MLDLNAYLEMNWEVKMPDGKIINIKQPTYKQLVQLEKMASTLEKDTNIKTQFVKLVAIVEFILNNNVEKETFNKDYIEETFNNSMLTALFFGYVSFANDIKMLPN